MEVKEEPGDRQNISHLELGENSQQQIVTKEVKIVLRDFRKDFSDNAKRKSEEEFFEFSAQMPKAKKIKTEEVKKDPEVGFLALPREAPKMPKAAKREVTRKKLIRTSRRTTFSKFQCQICEVYLCNQKSLNDHTELHFQPSSYDCKKCGKTFKFKHRLWLTNAGLSSAINATRKLAQRI